MHHLEKRPMLILVIGILGISLSSIFVKYSPAPSVVTAAWRLSWTVILSLASGVFLAIHFATWFESLKLTSVASSTTIVCTEVIWVCLGYCLFLKGKITGKAGLAIAVTLLGSILIAWSDSARGHGLRGDLLALAAAVAVAVYTLLGRIVRSSASTTVYTYLVYTACTAALLIMCAVQGHSLTDGGMAAPLVGLLLAVFSTILGHSIFSWCLKFFSPTFVSASKLCEPVVAAILAGFLFGEIPAPVQLLGGGLILGGVVWYSRLEMQS